MMRNLSNSDIDRMIADKEKQNKNFSRAMELLRAEIAGKTIQSSLIFTSSHGYNMTSAWTDIKLSDYDIITLCEKPDCFRIKPEQAKKKFVPFTFENKLTGKTISKDKTDYLVVSQDESGVSLVGMVEHKYLSNGTVSGSFIETAIATPEIFSKNYNELKHSYYFLNGSPCGKEVEDNE